MNSLAFPAPPQFGRPQSLERGHSFGGGPNDIPIDPALSGLPLDPALIGGGSAGTSGYTEDVSRQVQFGHHNPIPAPRQYSQGPQGDPFAPQPPSTYLREEPAPPPPKPVKKKRSPRRQEECGICHGNDRENKHKQPEKLVSCAVCGQSAHPGCIDLADIGDVVRSYEWRCFECKNCEICQRKEGDNRLMLCDACDRGWHLDCLDPPLGEPPDGKWHCPLCPPLVHSDVEILPATQVPEVEPPPETPLPIRESSVASSSQAVEKKQPIPDIIITDDSEVDMGGELTPATVKQKSKKKARWKGKAPMRNDPGDASVSPTTPMRLAKRMRIRLSSPAPPSPQPAPVPVLRLRLPPRGKGKAREEDPEETNHGLFDDVLCPEDRDTAGTSIASSDKQRFEKSRLAAEEKLFPRPTLPELPETAGAGPSTRPLRSMMHAPAPAVMPTPDRSVSPTPSTPGPLVSKVPSGQRIRRIRFGEYDIETWYDAPFPEEYANIPEGRLWICEFCLKYMKSRFGAGRHQMKCKMRHPPGDEIYRDGSISIFEVDGRKNKIYCQHLCLLSKMFLDHKSLFYDVEPFLFYVITEVDDVGARFVGYFSKEKRSPKDYNVSCIMTLPVRQRQGWGQLLIDFSYLLSKKEQRPGSPEKPLSALGALGYKSYWTHSLMRYFRTAPPNPRLEDVCAATSMTLEDIYNTLVQLNMISLDDAPSTPKPLPGQAIKFPKGRKNGVVRKHLHRMQTQDEIEKKGPFVAPTKYEIHWDPAEVEEYFAKWDAKNYLKLRPDNLKWSPFIVARTRKSEQLPTDIEGSSSGAQQSGASTSLAGGNATPSSEVPITPRPGSSVEGRVTTRSPALALFDDDNVVVNASPAPVPELQPAKALSVSDTPLVRSPSVEPENLAQVLQDQAMALKMSIEMNASNRRLRSRDISDSTPAMDKSRKPSDETPNTRKARSSTLRGADAPSTPIQRANGRASAAAVEASTSDGAPDEAPPKRQLRARPNVDQEAKRTMPIPRSSSSPRKRRRVDSSPEVETPLPPRRSLRHPAENKQPAPPSPRQQRKSSRLNGGAPGSGELSELSSMGPSTPNIPSGSHGAEAHDADGDAHSEAADRPAAPAGRRDTQNPRGGTAGEDFKYEDVDTPMTAMTSRHSVPSDDTVFVDDGGGEADKVYAAGLAVDVAMQPPAGARGAPQGGRVDVVDVDELGDEDAEGEDEDAEGELDDGGDEMDLT